MRQSKMYAVLAANGVMLHWRYDRAVYCRDHFFHSPCVIRRYDTLQEAIDATLEHLGDIAPLDRAIPSTLEVDKFYHVYRLRFVNEEEHDDEKAKR